MGVGLRINLDTDAFLNPCFDLLARVLGLDPDAARWKVVRVWAACSARRSPVLTIEEIDLAAGLDGFARAMLEVDLAQDFSVVAIERSLSEPLSGVSQTSRRAAEMVVERAKEIAKRAGARGAEAIQIAGVAPRIAFLFAQAARGSSRDPENEGEQSGDFGSKHSLSGPQSTRSRKAKASASESAERADEKRRNQLSGSTPSPDPSPSPDQRSRATPAGKPGGKEHEPDPEHALVVRGFHDLFKARRKGAEPSWGGREAKRVESLLKRAGGSSAEVLRRAVAMFDHVPRWPCELGGDLATLDTHFDKFAGGAGGDLRIGRAAPASEDDFGGQSGEVPL